ncbi:glycosyltransferase family 4 protein [Reyranella sp. CPCC 100927]|uniref:glycosyltransferase family 4 protein n=1 Tax=Reyranella sp. CPCC 100927 TaxID=2599616 RepID=UPI0011B4C3EB|nr:glycosyltransferase family 4 protein [Reyranella sp. CPCC 100927]TWT05925.1 glycosyltransferase family 4 protein [Reyranella sp. CPCC 100927]
MRIAQIAPIIEDVPPRLYGGTERIVSYLTEELVALGHDVTLFASGTSITTAELVPVVSEALRLRPDMHDPLPYYMIMLDRVRQRLGEFDILHFHIDAMHYPLMRSHADRVLTTLHGRQDLPELPPLYSAFPDLPLVSISNAQRRPIPTAHFVATVHHGLPVDLYRPTFSSGEDRHGRGRGYLAFLGRMAPEKRPDLAIEIARKAGLPLKLAAKVDKADRAYFCDCIAPLLKQPDIEFIGEINEREKERFLGEAAALLFPISWPEPFGLVMIEAMACGTPVLAFHAGSVPEVVDHGVTGLIVETVDQAVAALPDIVRLDRTAVRRCFERRFTSRRMATDYVTVYERQLGARRSTPFLTTKSPRSPMLLQEPRNSANLDGGSIAR